MLIKPFLPLRAVAVVSVIGLLAAAQAFASLQEVEYPVDQLGDCESQEACFAYCEESEHFEACVTFGEANGLLREEDVEKFRDVQAAIAGGGPGGCDTEAECKSYCGLVSHMAECVEFGEKNGLMDIRGLERAKQVLAALKAGYAMPGGCLSETACEEYCSDASHATECVAFAKAAGFLDAAEADRALNLSGLMESGEMPGGCDSRESCEEYCAVEEHGEECLQFAVRTGMMTEAEAEEIRTRNDETERAAGPGGCDSQEACQEYCEKEENRETCRAFDEARGEESGDEGGEDGEDGQEGEDGAPIVERPTPVAPPPPPDPNEPERKR